MFKSYQRGNEITTPEASDDELQIIDDPEEITWNQPNQGIQEQYIYEQLRHHPIRFRNTMNGGGPSYYDGDMGPVSNDGWPSTFSDLARIKISMAQAKAAGNYRLYRQLAAQYRQQRKNTIRLTPLVNSNGMIGYGRYRRRYGRRGMRRGRARLRRRYMRGRGFYKGFLGDALGGVGTAVGGRFGFANAGGMLGRTVGNWIARKTGFGAYGDQESTMQAEAPIMANTGQLEGTQTITRREYLFDVIAPSSAFQQIAEININPGDPKCMPWFAKIARQYERYKLHSMVFSFKSHSGDTTTSTAIGEVMGCWIENPNLKTPTTRQEVLVRSMAGAARADTEIFHFGVECDNRLVDKDWDYVRSKDVAAFTNAELENLDHGRYAFFVNGVPGTNTNIGSIWVSYEVSLASPKISNDDELAVIQSKSTQPTSTAFITASNQLGTNWTQRQNAKAADAGLVIRENPVNSTGTVVNGIYLEVPPGETGTFLCIASINQTGVDQQGLGVAFNSIKQDPLKQTINFPALFNAHSGVDGFTLDTFSRTYASGIDQLQGTCNMATFEVFNSSPRFPLYIGVQQFQSLGGLNPELGKRTVQFIQVSPTLKNDVAGF